MLVDAGRLYMLRVITGQQAVEPVLMGLYTNDVAWDRDTVLADLTEVAASGYALQEPENWTEPVLLAGGNGSTDADQVIFENNSGAAVTVKGYFYKTATTLIFLGGDVFPTPLVIPANIGTLSVLPNFQDNTLAI